MWHTVESHLARAYTKLSVHSKFELAHRADELGLTRDSP
jgi:DNA-binding NarL/FixJ family response regulator